MIKKILESKSLLLAVSSCVLSVLMMMVVTFAWFAISKTAKFNPFVLTVGVHGAEYEFGEVVGGNIVDQSDSRFEDLAVMPGNHYTFVLTIRNISDEDTLVNAYFSDVASYLVNGNDLSTDYSGIEYTKIQYLYSYKITKMYYNPTNTDIFANEGETVTYPTEDEVTEKGWIEIPEEGNEQYFTSSYFNLQIDGADQKNYYLLNNFLLDGSDKTGTSNSSVVIFFQITADNEPTLPEGLELGTIEPGYENQLFGISNIIITSNEG